MKTIGVMTSGGDAPGMNAAIRSVVRCAINEGLSVKGILRGYEGLINGEVIDMTARSVSNILSRGGTILKTARSKAFMTKEGRKQAFEILKKHKIEGIVIIGGNGSFKGAHIFWEEFKVNIIGIPGTIDNDISGSDYTLGAHTAVNTALEAIDKIRDTVTSMERIYIIEVMGRNEPFIAIRVGLAGGAEDVSFPGAKCNISDMCKDIMDGRKKGKVSWIIVVSEGASRAEDVAKIVKEKTGFEVRSIVLGHIQRGGSPVAYDRILASRLGYHSVETLLEGKNDSMVGIVSDELKITPFKEACAKDRKKTKLNEELYKVTRILAT